MHFAGCSSFARCWCNGNRTVTFIDTVRRCKCGIWLCQFSCDICFCLPQSRPGLEQYALKKFVAALEVFPKILADNAGVKSTELLAKLHAAHQEGMKNAGFNIEVC